MTGRGLALGASGHGRGWIWIALLGVGMVLGGLLAWGVAATRIMLPYDEAFVGLSQAEVAAINPRLLAFMAHDRVVLAGSMVSIGLLYTQLALHGLRRGAGWARAVVGWSGAIGFASFLLFVGYGYFDPLHAAVTLLLLPFFLLGLRERPSPATPARPELLVRPRRPPARWGQLLLIAIGAGLTAAGTVIAAIGVTTVFVPEDLAFMQTTRAAIQEANPRLIPLIAHDRAGLGGALACNGLGVLLTTVWGFRRGARWLWWTLLASGLPGFTAALGVHLAVGYADPWHLAPGLLALAAYILGLGLSYCHLCQPAPSGVGQLLDWRASAKTSPSTPGPAVTIT